MKLNDSIMEQTFSTFDEANDPVLFRVYGVVMATVGKMLLLGNLSALGNQYFLVGFSKTRLVMIRLDMLGKQKESIVIHFHDIRHVRISDWMFGMGKKIYIELSDGSKIRFKISKINVMLKKQKENLLSICDLLSSRFSGQ